MEESHRRHIPGRARESVQLLPWAASQTWCHCRMICEAEAPEEMKRPCACYFPADCSCYGCQQHPRLGHYTDSAAQFAPG
jgi:hypothetical protein